MEQNGMPDMEPGAESEVSVDDELREPPMFRVLLHNDDYTTMAFVVQILQDIFHKTSEEATAIMMAVHEKGAGVCGVYPREIAEFRVGLVRHRAQEDGFPLLCTMEKD